MKKFKILLSVIGIIAILQLFSCNNGGNSPVDRYIEVIDEATKKVDKLDDISMADMQEIISPEKAQEISTQYSDYQLTDKDKSKLKKSFGNLVKTFFKKVEDTDGLPTELKKQIKNQEQLVITAFDTKIENSNTLGELDGK